MRCCFKKYSKDTNVHPSNKYIYFLVLLLTNHETPYNLKLLWWASTHLLNQSLPFLHLQVCDLKANVSLSHNFRMLVESLHWFRSIFEYFACADPGSSVREGQRSLTTFFDDGREDPNTTLSGSSLSLQRNTILMAFRWRADDRQTWMLAWYLCMIFQGIRMSLNLMVLLTVLG